MKTKSLVSITGSALLLLSPTIWAAGHAGGGGVSGGFVGGGHVGGGVASRGGGVGFGRAGVSLGSHPYYYSGGMRGGMRFAQSRGGQVGSLIRQSQPIARQNRGINNPSSVAGQNRRVNNSATRTAGRAEFNQRVASHIAERHDINWHRDWDRRHVHFDRDHHRFFVFIDGFWCGLDDGFFPWDYYPYYAYDYDPYDYYADAEPNDNGVYSDTPVVDPTVTAVQTQLIQQGYYGGPVDGIYGPATRDAVAKYQIARNLDVSGSLSAQTLQSLGLPDPSAS